MSAIVRAEATGLATPSDVTADLPSIFRLAQALKQARGFLPQHLKEEGEIVAVVLAGRELGIPPMAAIRGIKLVKGNVTLDAALQLGCMMRAGVKVQWVEDGSKGRAHLRLTRPGHPPHDSVFTLEDAKRAGLNGENWTKYPANMLRARAVTMAGKAYCPDILAGVYLPGEIEGDDAAPVDAPRAAAPRERVDEVTGEVVRVDAEQVVKTLCAEVTTMADGQALADFFRHCKRELDAARASEEQRIAVSAAFGDRCRELGLRPADVARIPPSEEAAQ